MTIDQLTEQLRQRDATIGELTQMVQKLQGELEWCKRQLFGRKSERYEDPNQPKLFDESAESESSPPSEPESEPAITIPAHRRRDVRRGKRQPIPEHLRRQDIVHDLPEDQRIDPATGEPLLQRIGEEVSEKLAFKSGEVYVERHIRIKYRRLEENLDGTCPEVLTAPPATAGLAKCIAAPSLLAEIAVRKYADHLPLHRLVKIFARHQVQLSKASMCRWMQDIGELIAPLLDRMKQRLIEHSRIIGHDDTPVRQLEPGSGSGSGRTKTCRFWPALGQAGTSGYYVLFDYTQTRGRAGPENWFRDAQNNPIFVGGDLQCDAFSGYLSGGGLLDQSGPWRMVHIGCWAHVRRKFHDARLNAPGEACEALGRIGQLYEIESRLKDASDDQRVEVRQARALPLINTLFDWCVDQQTRTLPQSAIGKAITYALNQSDALRRYVEAGHRNIDNNACERALRGLAIGRKNWLFTGSQAGGIAAARLFSIIGSAQLHRLDPLAYLHDLIQRLPAASTSDIDQFLPDQWATIANR